MSSVFIGNDIEEWKKHFRISAAVGAVLSELGVTDVSDLEIIYEDENADLLPQIRAACANVIEFGRFQRARALTNPSPERRADMDPTITPTIWTTIWPTIIPAASPAIEPTIRPTIRVTPNSRCLAEVTRRKEKIKLIQRQIRDAASVDLCFVVDCTGNMSSYMRSVCDEIIFLSTEVKKLHPLISIRFAFVGYRDLCDGSDRISLYAFSKHLESFQRHVRSQRASGGRDECEDVLGGLHAASNLDWTSQTRILFHVGDAPCHGREFHNDCGDDYPSGDPNGLTASPILTKLKTNNILYSFGRINASTDKMISKFNEIVGSPYIATEPITASSFMTTVTKSVSHSVTESVSASFRTSDDADKSRKREVALDPSISNFSSIRAEGAFNFELELPTDLSALKSAEEDCGIIREGTAMVSVKVAPRPFAAKGLRAAFYAELTGGPSSKQVIVKESLYTNRSELTKAKYESFLACQRAAIFLALEFNKVKPRDCATVNFCNASVLQLAERAGQPFMCLEDKLNGTFEKYNSNSGYCAPNPTDLGTNHDAAQAFSHWTHHFTGGYCMVVDCQGVHDRASNTFTLTDPALHCRNVLRFGKTNLGTVGMDDFFKGHVCNGVCTALGLRLPSK